MPVFKKSTKKRENESSPPAVAATAADDFGTQPVKTLDPRVGMDCYRLVAAFPAIF
jgi:hypothetical protein